MRRFFVDTFYWIALFSARNRWYERVMAFDEPLAATDQLYTTDEILTEFLTYYSTATPRLRTRAARYVQTLLDTPGLTVIPQSRTGFLQALTLYLSRPDKHYSLTDCGSMLVMRREGLTDVLTNEERAPRVSHDIFLYVGGLLSPDEAKSVRRRRRALQHRINSR